MDLVLVAQITLSLVAASGALYAAACVRAARRAGARLEFVRAMERAPSVGGRSPAQRLEVAERLLMHAATTIAASPDATEEREAVLFGLNWADSALNDAELLAVQEHARLAAARQRLLELRSEAEELPAASTRRIRQ